MPAPNRPEIPPYTNLVAAARRTFNLSVVTRSWGFFGATHFRSRYPLGRDVESDPTRNLVVDRRLA